MLRRLELVRYAGNSSLEVTMEGIRTFGERGSEFLILVPAVLKLLQHI